MDDLDRQQIIDAGRGHLVGGPDWTAIHARKEPELPPIGSRWYAWGHHYEVTRHTTHDGEPAVMLQNVNARRDRPTVIARLLLRHGIAQ